MWGQKQSPITIPPDHDELFGEAVKFVVEEGEVSASYLQRRLEIGYARAARLLDQLEEASIVAPGAGPAPRKVLVHSLADVPPISPIPGPAPLRILAEKGDPTFKTENARMMCAIIEKTLLAFGIQSRVAVVNNFKDEILYALEIAVGTPFEKLLRLEKDLAVATASPTGSVRIAPIAGTHLVGIWLPKKGTKEQVELARLVLEANRTSKAKTTA